MQILQFLIVIFFQIIFKFTSLCADQNFMLRRVGLGKMSLYFWHLFLEKVSFLGQGRTKASKIQLISLYANLDCSVKP